MALRLTAEPAEEPVSLAEAKLHVRKDESDEDALIARLISAARKQAEQAMQRSLIDQQWTLTLDGFPSAIRLPMPRVTSITSLTYIDPNGDTQTAGVSGYQLDNAGEYANWLVPAYGYSWPATRQQPNAVTVVYRAGSSAAAVPSDIKQWILLLVGQWYAHREAGVEKAITQQPAAFWDRLLDPYRVPGL